MSKSGKHFASSYAVMSSCGRNSYVDSSMSLKIRTVMFPSCVSTDLAIPSTTSLVT